MNLLKINEIITNAKIMLKQCKEILESDTYISNENHYLSEFLDNRVSELLSREINLSTADTILTIENLEEELKQKNKINSIHKAL